MKNVVLNGFNIKFNHPCFLPGRFFRQAIRMDIPWPYSPYKYPWEKICLVLPWDPLGSLGPQKAGPSPCRDLMGFALCNAYIFTDIFPATPFLPLMPLVPQVCGRMPGSCPVRTRSRLNTWAAVKISCLRLVPKYRLSKIFSFCGGGGLSLYSVLFKSKL